MKFEIFFFQLMCICFGGLTSVVGASPLDTIPSPITDSFIPVNQRSVEPVRNPGDFIGQVFAPKPEDWQTRPEAQPITGVTLTIASGPRSGESVATNPSGYYCFPNVKEDELHLRVEKEHFEPKEVMVRRSGPTILANGDVPNYTRDPQQHPGNILIGHRWPDEVRFILEETLVVHDLLYVEGGRLPKGTDLGGFYSLGVVVIYSYQYADWKDTVGLLGTFAHEIAHAHQHATVSVDGSAWEVHGWKDTPEGRAYEEARRKDWEQVGKSPLDNIYGDGGAGGVALTETAAETCAHYWSVDRWGGRTAYGLLEVEAPNRYQWAEKWVPITIAVSMDRITISEIMVATKGGSLPQWIELYNPSDTHAVSLKGWKLEVVTPRSYATLDTFPEKPIKPQETLLMVSKQGRSSNNLQNEQIYDLSNLPHLQNLVLLREEFHMKLSNAAGKLIDEVGNFNPDDKSTWPLPRSLTEDGARATMIRIHDDGVPRLGTDASGWISAINTELLTGTTSYYGHPNDIGAPGIESGGALPVALSRFRAEHTDVGIIIKWVTESELNNAGFNILRSESKNGEFKIVNPRIIQGAGTTSERHHYTWTDTTAKPNVVYYYRIEDISHAGVREQLATVRMKGYVFANGKFTTRWADLKIHN
ncbi:hypothetical protein F4Z99_17985 [Candidatus Poribacteria bacterium]|nr:hypothetical protein [Candidatus Poribacteria bacterium]